MLVFQIVPLSAVYNSLQLFFHLQMVEMKQIEAKHDELEEKWMAKMNKMRQNYAKVQISSCPKIKAHYMIEVCL